MKADSDVVDVDDDDDNDDVDDDDDDDILLDDIEQAPPKRADMAYLLAYKHLGNDNLPVAMQNINITITVYNVGELEATNVALDDTEDWGNSSFFKVLGSAKTTWKSIPVGGSVSHSFTVIALTHGEHNSVPARLTYRQAGSENEIETSLSSVLGVLPIESLVKWRLRHAPFSIEWAIFLVLSGLATSLAFLMSSSAESELNLAVAESKKKN